MKSFYTWKKTISGRLTIIYVIVFVLVLLILNLSAYLGLRYYMTLNARRNVENTLEFLSNRLVFYNQYDTELIEEISRSEQNMYFRILSDTGRILFQPHFLENKDLIIAPGFHNLKIDGRNFIYKTSLILERGVFVGYIQSVREMTAEYRFLRLLLMIMSITSVLGIIAAILTGYTITKKTLKPINAISNTAKEISGTDISKRLKVEGPEDELTRLSKTFNSMLDRLEIAFQRERRFVSDASHELRTPISVIKGYINLLDRWGKEEEEVRDEAIEAIQKETENMKSLIEGLLFLARGDDQYITLNKTNFQADELIEEIIQETNIISDNKEIKSNRIDVVEINADREMIKQMLRIFIDNSIKYTAEGGEIKIDLINHGEHLDFLIEDTGIGIPENDLPHVFERFYRVDKSRTNRKGSGLGLSIAKWIIDKHNGEVGIESEVGKGTRVKISIPV
ncbi:MAG: sensor histidine kinase [Halanaerobiaceae bacterium]